MRLVRFGVLVGVMALVAAAVPEAQGTAKPSAGAGPVVVVETEKGTFEFETYPNEAPKTVAHIIELVNKRFYNGLRFHRVVPGFVVQVGDPQTRDMTKRENWGRLESGTPVGVGEFSLTADTRERRRRARAPRQRVDSRQPVLCVPQRRASTRRPVHRVRQGHLGHGRPVENRRGRSRDQSNREGGNVATFP